MVEALKRLRTLIKADVSDGPLTERDINRLSDIVQWLLVSNENERTFLFKTFNSIAILQGELRQREQRRQRKEAGHGRG
jgi:hypothetical protein